MVDLHRRQRMILPAVSSGKFSARLQAAHLMVNMAGLENGRLPCRPGRMPKRRPNKSSIIMRMVGKAPRAEPLLSLPRIGSINKLSFPASGPAPGRYHRKPRYACATRTTKHIPMSAETLGDTSTDKVPTCPLCGTELYPFGAIVEKWGFLHWMEPWHCPIHGHIAEPRIDGAQSKPGK